MNSENFIALGDRHRHGLFEQNILASLQGGNRYSFVLEVGHANDHRVYVRVRKQTVERGCHKAICIAITRRQIRGAIAVNIANACDSLACPSDGFGVNFANAARADDANSDGRHVVVFVLSHTRLTMGAVFSPAYRAG
jgi:hypothetical protein